MLRLFCCLLALNAMHSDVCTIVHVQEIYNLQNITKQNNKKKKILFYLKLSD